ncbi:MAG: hypothetical protein GY856_10810 [bacterium]|nr:hypothetical protein [bacterium]
MSRTASKLRSAVDSPAAVDPAPLPEVLPAAGALDDAEADSFDDAETDPYYYGWRERWEKTPDGGEKLHRTPLSYPDLLDPQEGDFIAEDTIHRRVVEDLANILDRRYQAEPSVAVWSNLKILFEIPGLTSGPGPDICVVAGVRDRGRQRRSFRYGQEPGEIRLVIEVVSKSSLKKDYQDLLKIYAPLGVEEYIAIRPLGFYVDGPFKLRGWRLDPHRGQLVPIAPDPEGRIPSQTTGLVFGPGAGGWGVGIWDPATGKRLRTSEEARALELEARRKAEEHAEQAEERVEQEAEARRQAEERVEQEATARRQAEERAGQAEERAEQEATARRKAEEDQQQAEQSHREMMAEIEQLRAQLPTREGDA